MNIIPITKETPACFGVDVEMWAPVVNYEGFYSVSNLGRIRSEQRQITYSDGRCFTYKSRLKSVRKNHATGYMQVDLSMDGIDKTHLVHRIVLEAFIGMAPVGHDACHNNGEKIDCRLSNLRWGTKAENTADVIRHGRFASGERCHWKKLTDDQFAALLLDKGDVRAVANNFGVSVAYVYLVRAGKSSRQLHSAKLRHLRAIGMFSEDPRDRPLFVAVEDVV